MTEKYYVNEPFSDLNFKDNPNFNSNSIIKDIKITENYLVETEFKIENLRNASRQTIFRITEGVQDVYNLVMINGIIEDV